jgi:serine/threonine protein kinase
MSDLTSYINTEDVLMTTDYHLIKLLGEGSYGKVILVSSPRCGVNTEYAMKLLEYNVDEKTGNIDDYFAICEAYFTRMIKHPHIMTRYEFGFTQTYSYFTMQKADAVLSNIIPHLSINEIYQYIYQIADTIDYLHQGGFVYCDVKPSNILIIDGVLKIADLGYVKCIENAHCADYVGSECQTVNYRAPEQYTLNERSINKFDKLIGLDAIRRLANDNVKGEYWSLGILFLDIIYRTSFLTFVGNNHIKIASRTDYLYPAMINIIADNRSKGIPIDDSIVQIFGPPKDYPLLCAICNHLLQLDPNKRSLTNFLADPVINNGNIHRVKRDFIFPFVEQMYHGSFNKIKYHQKTINWMVEICVEYSFPLIITMNAIDYYIQHCHLYNDDELECLSIVSLWLVDRLFNPTDEAVSVEVLTYTTGDNVSAEEFNGMVKSIMLSTDGYPVFESLYFYLPNDELVKQGFMKMINLEKYIKYQSPRNLADRLVVNYIGKDDVNIINRHNIVTSFTY